MQLIQAKSLLMPSTGRIAQLYRLIKNHQLEGVERPARPESQVIDTLKTS
jgi:hypothetical protein